ncbi:hypothetical protein [Spirosoma gilvum]
MKQQKETGLDFEVDFLTNSIRNTISGDSFQTEVLPLTTIDLKQLTRKNGWQFNWKTELEDRAKQVYKLTIVHNPNIIQGVISFTLNADHVYMDLLESAPFNLGQTKLYEGVAGNLVAYVCKVSFQHGFDGYVSFTAKTKLIEHYRKTLSAVLVGGQLMVINTLAAKLLVDRYFKTTV